MVEVEADRFHHQQAELALPVDLIGTLQGFERVPAQALGLMLERHRDEALEEGLEIVEDRGDVGGAVARIELLHQCVIGGELQYFGAALRFLPHQFKHAGQGGRKALPIIVGPQLPPELFGAHGGFDLPLDEGDRETGHVGVLALEFGEREPLVAVKLLGCRGLDPVGDLGRRCLGMDHAGQRRNRLGALLAAARGHVGRLVGPQDRQGMFEGFELVSEGIELGERHGGPRTGKGSSSQ